MAAELRETFDAQVELIEGSGGVFEVVVDDDLVYSKKNLGRHADDGEVVGLIRKRQSA